MNCRRSRFFSVLMLIVGSAITVSAQSQPPGVRERKNIDILPDDEFQAYKHALAVLQHRTGDKSLQYFADLHDVFGPIHGCEHQDELFFPWHRSLLFYFEQALRESDPNGASGPSTANVTIPYWDWTVPPSGTRYPKRFEEPGSPLNHDFRNTQPLRAPMFPKASVFKIIGETNDWAGFAGGPKSNKFYGAIEQPVHNGMHSQYVGGDMGDPTTAAEDPIFWSFHAYIDLIWDRWQKLHRIAPTCLDCALQGLPAEKTAKDLVDVEQQLGYFYGENQNLVTTQMLAQTMRTEGEAAPAPRVIDLKPPESKEPDHRMLLPAHQGLSPETFDFPIPRKPFKTARLLFVNVKVPTTISYRGDIYLHKKGEQLEAVKKDSDNPPIGLLEVWMGHDHSEEAHHMHGHQAGTGIYVDITGRLKSLAETHAGENRELTIAFEEIPVKSRRTQSPNWKALPVEEEVQFDTLRLVLDGNYAETERKLEPAAEGGK